MKEGWTTRWKALFIWLSGYLSFIAFAVVGGYVIVKSEDEELKKTAKTVLIVTLIFTAISMFLGIYSGIGNMTDNYYASNAYDAYGVIQQITNIAKIVVYAVFALIAFFGGKNNRRPQVKRKRTRRKKIEEVKKKIYGNFYRAKNGDFILQKYSASVRKRERYFSIRKI